MNTRISKNIKIDERMIRELISNTKNKNKILTIDEEIEIKLNSVCEKAKISRIREYIPTSFDLKPFPFDPHKLETNLIENKAKDGEESEEINSEETKCSFMDSLNLLKELNSNIKKFRKKNKDAIEKEKKIHILQNNKINDDEEKEKSKMSEEDDSDNIDDNEEENEIDDDYEENIEVDD